MALLQDVLIPIEKKSNFDRSHRNRTDVGVGVATPVFTRAYVPDTNVSIRSDIHMESYPLLGKLMGSFTVKVAWFWIPQRLYSQQLDQNQLNFDPSTITFPTFRLPTYNVPISSGSPWTPRRGFLNWVSFSVSPNTLLDYIGVAPGSYDNYGDPSNVDSSYWTRLDATPVVGYYDIMRNYYMNTQEQYCYIYGRLNGHGNPIALDYGVIPYRPRALDNFVNFFVQNPGTTKLGGGRSKIGVHVDDNPNSEEYATEMTPIYDCCGGVPDHENRGDNPNFAGLFVVNHQPDLFTTWLSSSTYQQAVDKTRIVVPTSGENAQNITINQLRYSSHLMDFFERGILAGGRYDDWVESQFGVRTSRSLCIPQLLGVHTGRIIFNDIANTSQTSGTTATASGLGGKSSIASGQVTGRPIHVHTTEHGWIMGIMTIVPNVSYGQGIKPDLLKTRYTDLYSTSFDRIGFQALPLQWLRSIPVTYTTQDAGEASKTRKLAYQAPNQFVGYQPAWLEYCTATDEVHGSFVPGAGLDYMTLTRDFSNPFGVVPVSGSVASDPYVYTGTAVWNSQFQYPFEDTGDRACRFWFQAGFDVRVRFRKSKNIMPNIL